MSTHQTYQHIIRHDMGLLVGVRGAAWHSYGLCAAGCGGCQDGAGCHRSHGLLHMLAHLLHLRHVSFQGMDISQLTIFVLASTHIQ